MKNIVVDYKTIIELIKKQFTLIQRNNDEFKDIIFDVGDEQLLAKSNMDKPNFIFILTKFGGASTNFGQAVIPVTLEIIGLNNETELTQSFLNHFTNEYNRTVSGNLTQLYLSPSVSTNMNPIYAGFRSLFTISGTFVVDNSLIKLTTLKYYADPESDDYEEIEVIAFTNHSENSLNPQPYSNNNGRVKSYGSFSTLGFSIVTYPDGKKDLIQKVWSAIWDFTESHQNDTFVFAFEFAEFGETVKKEFKLHSTDFTQRIGENAVITIGFSL